MADLPDAHPETPALEVRAVGPAALGEPVVLELVMTGGSADDEWLSVWTEVRARHRDGHVAQNPAAWHVRDDRWGGEIEVSGGASWTKRFHLDDHAWLDAPGAWTVEVTLPRPAMEPLVASTTVTVAPVDLARSRRAVARELASVPLNRFEDELGWLGHPWAVTLLEAHVGVASLPFGDDRATRALATCPTLPASEALLRAWDAHPEPSVREVLYRDLPLRIREGWLRDHAWNADLDAALLARARGVLDAYEPKPPEVDGDRAPPSRDTTFAAEVVASLGDPTDVPALLRVLRWEIESGDQVDGLVDAVIGLGGPLAIPEDVVEPLLTTTAFPGPERVPLILARLEAGADPAANGARLLAELNVGACSRLAGDLTLRPEDVARVVAAWRSLDPGDPPWTWAPIWDPVSGSDLVPPGVRCVPYLRDPSIAALPSGPRDRPPPEPLGGPWCIYGPIPVADDVLVHGVSVQALAMELDRRVLGPVPLTWEDGTRTTATLTLAIAHGTGEQRQAVAPLEVCRRTYSDSAGVDWGLDVRAAGTLRTADGRLDEQWTGWLGARTHRNQHRWYVALDPIPDERLVGSAELRSGRVARVAPPVTLWLDAGAGGANGRLEGVDLSVRYFGQSGAGTSAFGGTPEAEQ